VDSLHFTFRHQTAALGSSEALRQSEGKSSRGVDSTWRLSVIDPASGMDRDTYWILPVSESWFYLPADYEMIWLPDGDEVSDRENHMIQSLKLMLTFVWNPQGFQIVDAMPTGEMFPAACYIRNILTEIVARRGEKGKRRLAVHADNAKTYTAKVTRAFCHNDFLQILRHLSHGPYLPYSPDLAPLTFACLGISKTVSKDSNSDLHTNFFQESEKFWTKSALTL
jgi:hypothetical protein